MTIYEVKYDTGDGGDTTVKVTEKEAREAFDKYADDYNWTAFEDEAKTVAEMAARDKLNPIHESARDNDVELRIGPCIGVREREEMKREEVYEIAEDFADELEQLGFDVSIGTTGGDAEFYASVPANESPSMDREHKINISCSMRHQ